jgi:diguanylate cyclase (GGDEF)-like protein/PAS domain S-box-containing protein
MIMTRPSVLLVDDEPQVLVALDDLLCDEFDVFKTESAEQALNLAKDHPDLAVVVTDQRMPKVTGDQLVANLSGCSDAVRILLTGFADLSAVVRAVNDGHIFAYVTKPWNPDDLLLKVHKAVEHFRVSKALAEEQRLLRDLMDSVPDGIYFKDPELKFLRVNRAHAALINGGHTEEIVGKHLHDLAPENAEALAIEAAERQVLAGIPAVDVERTEGVNGSRRWFSESKAAIRGTKGEAIGLVGITRDITERKQQQERIARLTRIRAVTGGINAALVRMRERGPLLEECCRIAVALGGLGLALAFQVDPDTKRIEVISAEPAGCPLLLALSERLRAGDEALADALRALAESSSPRFVDEPAAVGFPPTADYHALAAFPLPVAGQARAMLCLFSEHHVFDEQELVLLTEVADNITFGLEHIAKTQRLDFLAYHDELTRLPNRSLFLDRLNQHIQSCRSTGSKTAVLIADIGRFRQINETLGRSAGDQLLVQIAGRLGASVPALDTVARFDSNTFAVLATAIADEREVARLAENAILPALKDCFYVGGTELRVAAKLGIALFPSDGATAEEIVVNAEAALKNAKQSVSGYLFYAPSMHDRVAERLSLETRLRRAVEAHEFELHYQPKVDLRTGTVVGLEALMRWRDPEHGLISPAQFIPLLEETGLIREVGHWALVEASAQFMSWANAGLLPPRIAVNVSAIQLAAPDMEQSLRDCPDSSSTIDIEITESVFVKDLAGSVAKLEGARRLGLKVAIDDFGTGYSSLGYLSRLPIDALKIDRSFIVGMMADPQETTIVTTIISLAHAMDLKVIAEGVETKEQARLLRLLKCDQMQGYLVSRPQPAAEIAKLLGKRFDFMDTRDAS